jgi:TRAP transporter TAXI family solute receptor
MAVYKLPERKPRTKLWILLILLTVGTLALSMWLMGPSPPKKIVMATGAPGGGYAKFGEKYKERLAKMGLEVELVNTNGSIDNLEQLVQGKADIAFAQGGTYRLIDDPKKEVRGIAAIYLEPLWVFYRGRKKVRTFSDFKGKRISIGPPGSGTEAVGEILLKTHGITRANSRVVNLSMKDARQMLDRRLLDVAVFVSTYQDTGIQALLRRRDLSLMNFTHQDVAHSRHFPYLQPVKLSEGLFNLKENIPPENETLLAPAAMLVCRKDLHPQVVEQVLKAAYAIHAGGSLVDPPNHFPTLEGVDVQIDPAAQTYMKSGESFLSRVLPYWGVRLVLQARILLLPLLAVWIPFLKILPMIYNFRVNSLLKRHYAALREVESAITNADNPADLRDRLEVLEHLRTEMEGLSRKVPAKFQRDVYHWRLHISLVRNEALERLARMEKEEGGSRIERYSTLEPHASAFDQQSATKGG